MENLKKLSKLFLVVALMTMTALAFSACGDDEDEPESSSSSSSGSVKVTSIVQGKKSGSHYSYKITVKYTGSASDVKQLGFSYGKGTSMVGGGKKHTTSAVTTYTGSADFYTGTTYYIQPYVILRSGKTLTGTKQHTSYIR